MHNGTFFCSQIYDLQVRLEDLPAEFFGRPRDFRRCYSGHYSRNPSNGVVMPG
jgi:hypothetical protein